MKLKYDSHLTFKMVKEFYDIYINRKLILKNNKIRLNIPFIMLSIVCFWILLSLVLMFLVYLPKDFYINYFNISSYIIPIPIVVLLLYFFTILSSFLHMKGIKSNNLEINKLGITDTSDGLTIKVSKDKIDAIVIGKFVIVVLTSSKIGYCYPIKYKDKITGSIKKEMPNINIYSYK